MKSNIFKSQVKEQMTLCYDCLLPEEAYKIMDVLSADDMCETVQWMDIDLSYGVTGYRDDDDKRIWSRELVLFIDGIVAVRNKNVSIEEQLEYHRKELEKLRDIIKERTGID